MNERLSSSFDKAKKLSDFIGMLTRLAFLVLLATLVAADMETQGWFGYLSRLCTLLFLGGLSIFLAIRVADIVGMVSTILTVNYLNGQEGKLRLALAWTFARVVTLALLLGSMGLSISLIDYGSMLAARMLEETHVQIE